MTNPKWLERLPIGIIKGEAERTGLNWILLAAIAQKESSGDGYAMRYERNWLYFFDTDRFARLLNITEETERQAQRFSYGHCQLMLSVARELGFAEPAGKLFDPIINFHYAANKLKKLIEKHKAMPDAISSYNQGSPRRGIDGKFKNQLYVDGVMKLMDELEMTIRPKILS